MHRPGIIGGRPHHGGAPYVAGAVKFGAASYLSINSLVAVDNAKFAMVFWFNLSAFNNDTVFVVDPAGVDSDFMWFGGGGAGATFFLSNPAGSEYFTTAGTSTNYLNAWHSAIYSGETNFAAGAKISKFYLDDVDLTNVILDASPSFDMAYNGLPLFVGSDTFGEDYRGDIADLRIMPGTSLLSAGDIPLATRRLFIDGAGKPVNPAVATATLGSPCILFSGDASGFPTNQGTGGAFTLTGTLTNASTSPSG